MAKRIAIGTIVVFAIWSATLAGSGLSTRTPPAPAASTADLTAKQWREDLRFLAKELPDRHKNLFFHLTKEQFEQEVAAIEREIPALKSHQIAARFVRLAAAVGDGHTGISPFRAGQPVLPFAAYWSSDGITIVRAAKPYARAVGCRIVSVGGSPIERACAHLAAYIPHENDHWVRDQAPGLLTLPELLHADGLSPAPDRAAFTLEDATGKRFEMEMPTPPAGAAGEWAEIVDARPTGTPVPLTRKRPRESYWFEYVPEHRLLYFQYNRCSEDPKLPFEAFAKQLWEAVEGKPVVRFVIDLRMNGGGSSGILDPFITDLRQKPDLNKKGVLFVVIGRRTFSSALQNALRLKRQTQAILVGEPTGGKPSAYGEVKTFDLPNSKLTVRYSTKYFYDANQEPTLAPDIAAAMTFKEFLAGRDPVVDAILNHRPADASARP